MIKTRIFPIITLISISSLFFGCDWFDKINTPSSEFKPATSTPDEINGINKDNKIEDENTNTVFEEEKDAKDTEKNIDKIEDSTIPSIDNTNNKNSEIKGEKEEKIATSTPSAPIEKEENSTEYLENGGTKITEYLENGNVKITITTVTTNRKTIVTEIYDKNGVLIQSNKSQYIITKDNSKSEAQINSTLEQIRKNYLPATEIPKPTGTQLPQNYEAYCLNDVEDKIIDLVNNLRIENGIKPLQKVDILNTTARYKSNSMVQLDYFGHLYPYEEHCFNFVDIGYRYGIGETKEGGENISSHTFSPYEKFNAEDLAKRFFTNWINSQGHRDNILNPKYNSIGVGIIAKIDKNKITVLATQHFYNM